MTGQADSARPPHGEYLAGHLQQRLAEDPRVSEQGISVEVAGADVYLTGVVGTGQRRDAISAVAAECAGGHRVHNEVTVCGCAEPTAEETIS
jgi:osmotically-inducible protein OsmY